MVIRTVGYIPYNRSPSNVPSVNGETNQQDNQDAGKLVWIILGSLVGCGALFALYIFYRSKKSAALKKQRLALPSYIGPPPSYSAPRV